MRIAVTGKHGQVARALAERGAAAGHDVQLVGRPLLELGGSPAQLASALGSTRPDLIVSAAAYTFVDQAEREPEIAFRINEDGARSVAEAAASLEVPLIHLSTDYVFDGCKGEPYAETDETLPLNIYGASKLAGERAVKAAHQNSVIVRTAWVYGPCGRNFVQTMLQMAETGAEVAVVADQIGSPTSSADLADAVIAIAQNLTDSFDARYRGIFHVVGGDDASWATLARETFACSLSLGGPSAEVRPIATSDYPTAARRPADSRLNADQIERIHGVRLPSWRVSLPPTIERILAGHR